MIKSHLPASSVTSLIRDRHCPFRGSVPLCQQLPGPSLLLATSGCQSDSKPQSAGEIKQQTQKQCQRLVPDRKGSESLTGGLGIVPAVQVTLVLTRIATTALYTRARGHPVAGLLHCNQPKDGSGPAPRLNVWNFCFWISLTSSIGSD